MSVKPSKNPVPKRTWNTLVKILNEHGVQILETQMVIIDEVGDEYTAFAVVYAKEVPSEGGSLTPKRR